MSQLKSGLLLISLLIVHVFGFSPFVTELENIGLNLSTSRKMKNFSIDPECLLSNFTRSGKENPSCQYTCPKKTAKGRTSEDAHNL